MARLSSSGALEDEGDDSKLATGIYMETMRNQWDENLALNAAEL